jgi:hypothetical protein
MLSHFISATTTTHNNLILNKIVLLKVSLFSWIMLHKRLPTKDNLIHRGVLLSNGVRCSGGCGIDKDVNYMLVGCIEVQSIWSKIQNLVRC